MSHTRKRARIAGFALLVFVLAAYGLAGATPGKRTGGSSSKSCNDGTVSWDPTTFWPPNHKMQTVNIRYDEGERDGDTISITVDAIRHNQADTDGQNEMPGSGQPVDQQGLDWAGVGNSDTAVDSNSSTGADAPPAVTTGQVRAERSGNGHLGGKSGRTYTITVTCVDSHDQSGGDPQMQTIDITACVPHDQGKNSVCS
jgi:hypothetical protein